MYSFVYLFIYLLIVKKKIEYLNCHLTNIIRGGKKKITQLSNLIK